MFVILNRKAFETALIEVPLACQMVVSIGSHRVCANDPFAKSPHFSIDQRTQNQMPVSAHDLVSVKLHLIESQCFVKNFLESDEIAFLSKNFRTQVGSV